jgi:glycerol dehydrogenase
MSRVFIAPGKYVQGSGTLQEIGKYASVLGSKALAIGGRRALAVTQRTIESSLGQAGMSIVVDGFRGECSQTEIKRVTGIAKRKSADLIIAVGGGKAIDTGKAVACDLRLPVVVVPTIAATDAPCSTIAAIYTENGMFKSVKVSLNNPNCVLVDTDVIANAPVDTLVAGMGDALATFWEADTCYKSQKPNRLTGGTSPPEAAYMLARLCYDLLLRWGIEARLSVEKKVVTPALEKIVEANILLSGLGFESGGLAGAHSVATALDILPAAHKKYHGEKVAFGTLVQLVMEGRAREDINEVTDFCTSVGLPTNLAALGVLVPSKDDIMKVAERSVMEGRPISATWFPVTAKMVYAAIFTADAIGSL